MCDVCGPPHTPCGENKTKFSLSHIFLDIHIFSLHYLDTNENEDMERISISIFYDKSIEETKFDDFFLLHQTHIYITGMWYDIGMVWHGMEMGSFSKHKNKSIGKLEKNIFYYLTSIPRLHIAIPLWIDTLFA